MRLGLAGTPHEPSGTLYEACCPNPQGGDRESPHDLPVHHRDTDSCDESSQAIDLCNLWQ
jgi:hypothetical protein